jgi:hypothetical protein
LHLHWKDNLMIIAVRRSRFHWTRDLRRGSAATRLLRIWVRIPPRHWYLSVASIVGGQVEVSAISWSLVQRNTTDCGASLCVWSRNLVNEEALAHCGVCCAQKTYCLLCHTNPSPNKSAFFVVLPSTEIISADAFCIWVIHNALQKLGPGWRSGYSTVLLVGRSRCWFRWCHWGFFPWHPTISCARGQLSLYKRVPGYSWK